MLATKSDTAFLVEECKSGKQYAYHELYEKYVNAMYSTALRILQNTALAEDKVQEAFVKAFQTLDALSDAKSFGGWLKRIVINSCLNEVKRKKPEFVAEDHVLEMEQEESDGLDYPELSVDDIKREMRHLPDGYRIILNLFLFENYSHKDIAEQLNISPSTSRTQYMRAKSKLKELLLKNYGRQQ